VKKIEKIQFKNSIDAKSLVSKKKKLGGFVFG
jgi:hypothetical protein